MPLRTGIRYLSPEQANRLRSRVDRDATFYHHLARRLCKMPMKDDVTHKATCACERVRLALIALNWAAIHAGTGPPVPITAYDKRYDDPEEVRDVQHWLGEGI
jgi:hypothetical protein